jgi:4-amino-4-deoxy-L-arabinose transferase-like glycosyltransferase
MGRHMGNTSTESGTGSRRAWLCVLILVACSGLLRAGAIAARANRLSADPDAYRLIAENLVQRGVFSRSTADVPAVPTVFRPPLYPLLLAATSWNGEVRPLGVAIVHVLTGMVTIWIVYLLGRRWGLQAWSYLAAIGVAVDPILLNQAGEVMTETLATLFAVLSLLALMRWDERNSNSSAAVAGAAMGLSILCRPTFLVWAGLCGLYVLVTRRNGQSIRQLIAFSLAVGVVLLPWGVRNYRAVGRPIVTTAHGGYTLLLANNTFLYQHLRTKPWGSVWDARELDPLMRPDPQDTTRPSLRELPELESDRALYDLAKQTIREQPGMFAYASLVRLGCLWSPLAHQVSATESRSGRAARWAAAAWYASVFLLALLAVVLRVVKLEKPPWVWGLLVLVAFSMIHAVYWTNIRMRAPLMPVVYLAAAAFCASRSRRAGS